MRSSYADAIAQYHSLIQADTAAASEQYAAFREAQKTAKSTFGGRPLANTLRPALLTETMYMAVQDAVYTIRQAVLKLAAAYFSEPEHMRELGLTETEIELISIPTNVIRLSATARMDAFLTADSFKFVEINAEVPAGPAYSHVLARLFESLPIFQQFNAEFPMRYVDPLEHLIAGLLRTYHEEFGGRIRRPSFAIVDRLDVPTFAEFELTKDYLERFGFPTEICDPRALELRDGWIYANGTKIDILYRRLLTNEFLEARDDCKAYFEGYVAQKTCYLNTFRAKMVHKKAIFAFLTDERYNHILTDHEIDAITRHIPWTRRIHEQRTSFRGLRIDLLEFIRSNRRYFVIKPNDEYGGKDVCLGFASTPAEWESAIELGLQRGFVVQETVDIHREPFPYLVDGEWQEVPTVLDLDPYLNGPLMGGCLARISSSNLANVTAGAGTVPQFILRYVK